MPLESEPVLGAKNSKNLWRPLAILILAVTSGIVSNENQPTINPDSGQNDQNHQPETLSPIAGLPSQELLERAIIDSFVPSIIEARSDEPEQPEAGNSQDLKAVIGKMSSRPDLFSQRQIEDVTIYHPIYKAVADKFGIQWYLLWIVHEAESTVSTNPDAFNGKSGYIGGFSRHPNWSESVVDQAATGLEYLAGLPQRNPTDWQEAAFAAWHLTKIRKDDTVLGSLRSYSAKGPAYYRWGRFQLLPQIFD